MAERQSGHHDDDPHLPPELRIPDELRRPVEKPDSLRQADGEAKSTTGKVVEAARGWAIAFDFVFTILAGVMLGWLLDRWQGWMPWGTLGGLAFGFLAAFMRIIRATMREEADEARRRRERR